MPQQKPPPADRLHVKGSGRRYRGGSAQREAQVAKIERQWQALEQHCAGKSIREISQAMGLHYHTVSGYIRDAIAVLQEHNIEKADQLRSIQSLQLDQLFASLWPDRAEPKVAAQILRILERRAKLYGLDAPVRHEHRSVTHGLDLSQLSEAELDVLDGLLSRCAPAPEAAA